MTKREPNASRQRGSVDLADMAPPHWKPAILASSFVLGLSVSGFTYLFNAKADEKDVLSTRQFYQYMDEYKREQKADFQRIEDKIDRKADKP
jgi:hypothetical protein